MSSKSRLSDEEIAIARYATSALLIVSGILAIVSVSMYWWLVTGTGVNTAYFPGASYRANGTFITYASAGFGPVGAIFEAVLVLAIVAGALLIIGGALKVVSTIRHREPHSLRLPGLAIAGVVLEGLAALIAPAMVPWATKYSSAGSAYCGGWTVGSPCSSYWGSGFYGGVSLRFVAADGWIMMIGALAVGVLGLVVWYLGRNPA